MAEAFYLAYKRYFADYPKPEAIKILLSHWALETGWGKSMWCYNVGNAKAKPGGSYDWCFFRCNEIIDVRLAETMAERDPEHVQITKRYKNGRCITWFEPKHRWSCFRAFRSLEDGAYDHLKLIVQKFDKAWPYVVAGNPERYSRALKGMGYYTADEEQYTRVLKAVYNKFDKIEFPAKPLLTAEERTEAMNLVAFSLQNMTEEALVDVRVKEE